MAPARKAAKKAGKKANKKAAKGGKKAGKKAAKKTGGKKAATKSATTDASRPKNVKFETRKKGVFSTTDLYDQIQAWNPQLKKSEARQVVDDMLNTVKTAIRQTGKVRLKGIGTITTKKVPARKGGKLVKNPFTGEMVKQKPKAASVKVKLNAAADLKS